MKCKFLVTMMAVLLLGQTASAQSVFSPSVNGVRTSYQSRRAASPDAQNERIGVVVTCSVEASAAAIANQMIELGAVIRVLMGNQLVVDLPMAKLDEAAAIEGVLLIDMPSKGNNRTDTARKASHVDEAHAGKMAGEKDLPQAYTGKGVIIGLIDDGYDYTHPMFKNADGSLCIKGVYRPWDMVETRMKQPGNLNLENIPVVDNKGVATQLTLSGCFFTNPKVILDTTIVKDNVGSHGTHCASIAAGRTVDYTQTLVPKYESSGKLGGMAPDADLVLTECGMSEKLRAKFPNMNDDELYQYGRMEGLWAMKHYADEQKKPLVISWSQNGHDGFHDGTSTAARYVANYCKPGNIMALCASNEGGDSMYIERTIDKGKSLKLWCDCKNDDGNAFVYIRTDKEIKVDMFLDDMNYKVVKECHLPLTSKGTNSYEKTFYVGVKKDEKGVRDFYYGDKYYQKLCSDFLDYIKNGEMWITVNEGTGIDENNKQFNYVRIHLQVKDMSFQPPTSTSDNNLYTPVLVITSPDEDVKLQAWGDYFNLLANSMEYPDDIVMGYSNHSMGDWNTSGEPVSIGAYATDINLLRINSETGKLSWVEAKKEKVGRYASFSSYGKDFSSANRTYPDVSAPGYAIYAAINSFDSHPDHPVYSPYSGQFEGQTAPRNYPFTTFSGTSMSTPAAAGVIALWVQAATENGKTLTNADIKDIIRHSSDTDDFTKAASLRYGAGKINAYKGLLYLLDTKTNIPELPTRHIGATLNGRILHISGDLDIQVTIYNLSGQKVFDAQAQSGIVELPALPAGVYAVKMGNQGSTLIRL